MTVSLGFSLECNACGADNLVPMNTKPPATSKKGSHACDDECVQGGLFCLNCRIFRPVPLGVEVSKSDGLMGVYVNDVHGPWQATAPMWAITEFAWVKELVRTGKWANDHPVGGLIEGHVVHTEGLWDDGERVVWPERNTMYVATVEWSDGTRQPLVLWNGTGRGD